ncbi:MAG: hypothetical protein KKB37_08055 [Alphaproteobacteria bacterium]|nr:hypothetical protein [Alphaproteobacteria bacterium]
MGLLNWLQEKRELLRRKASDAPAFKRPLSGAVEAGDDRNERRSQHAVEKAAEKRAAKDNNSS